MVNSFAVGQRWISETEPELGMGLVRVVEGRQVGVLFPGSGEERRYALQSAPLNRVRFQVGDEIQNIDGEKLIVESIDVREGLMWYLGEGLEVSESRLEGRLAADRPYDRFFTGKTEGPDEYLLRKETLQFQHQHWLSSARGFVGGKVELIPHQFYIAHEVVNRMKPRVLLSDEVGLGKTIEACLILHHLLTVGRVQRALILVPNALVHQWFVELLRRFHLSFSLYDEERCQAIESGNEGGNPFEDDQWILCASDLLDQNPNRAVQCVEAGWDLIIVDEAHRLVSSEDEARGAYRALEALSHTDAGLLLLTATPEQTGLRSHYDRLRLLDPDRFSDYDQFLEDHDTWVETARAAGKAIKSGDREAAYELIDQHGPGRVMFRNTRDAMPGFPKRHVHPVELAGEDEDQARVDWLVGQLNTHKEKKWLVITETRQEVETLYEALRKKTGIDLARFHEDMPLIECDRQAAWFSETDGARILIASAVGGEGRNFQFVQDLVLLHLPDHPDRLEQRIGRIDRIGQKGEIHLHVPFINGSPDAQKFNWFHRGLNALAKPLVGGDALYQQFQDKLADGIDDALIRKTKQAAEKLKNEVEMGRDRLLEMNSNRPEVIKPLLEKIKEADADKTLEPYLLRLLDHFGVHAEELDLQDYLLVRGHLFTDAFPLKQERQLITLSRIKALARDDMDFMSWDHPLLLGGMELLLGSEQGRCASAASSSISTPCIEFMFLLESVAPPQLGISRFLPPVPLVVRLDPQGTEIEAELENLKSMSFSPLDDRSPFTIKDFAELTEKAEARVEEIANRNRQEASEKMIQTLGGELRRLIQLKQKNTMIRDEEIQDLQEQIETLSTHIQEARIRLDSIVWVSPAGTQEPRGSEGFIL